MLNLKIGKFPGRIDSFTLEDGTSVRDALNIAGVDFDEFETSVKLDDQIVSLDSTITPNAQMLLVTKRIKGANK